MDLPDAVSAVISRRQPSGAFAFRPGRAWQGRMDSGPNWSKAKHGPGTGWLRPRSGPAWRPCPGQRTPAGSGSAGGRDPALVQELPQPLPADPGAVRGQVSGQLAQTPVRERQAQLLGRVVADRDDDLDVGVTDQADAMMIIARRTWTDPCFPRRTICCSRQPSSSASRRARTGLATNRRGRGRGRSGGRGRGRSGGRSGSRGRGRGH